MEVVMVSRSLAVAVVALVAFLGACQGESMGVGGSGSGGEGGEGGGEVPHPCVRARDGELCGGSAEDPIHGECSGGSCLWIEWTCHYEPAGSPCSNGSGVCARSTVEPVCCDWCVTSEGLCSHAEHLGGAPCSP